VAEKTLDLGDMDRKRLLSVARGVQQGLDILLSDAAAQHLIASDQREILVEAQREVNLLRAQFVLSNEAG
jgi:hypothetical protein